MYLLYLGFLSNGHREAYFTKHNSKFVIGQYSLQDYVALGLKEQLYHYLDLLMPCCCWRGFIDSCEQAHLMLSKKSKHISVHQPSSVKASVYSVLSLCSSVYCGDHCFTPITFWFSNAALSHVYRCFTRGQVTQVQILH